MSAWAKNLRTDFLSTYHYITLWFINHKKTKMSSLEKYSAKKLLEVMSHYPFVESVDGRFPAIEHSEGPHPCAILFYWRGFLFRIFKHFWSNEESFKLLLSLEIFPHVKSNLKRKILSLKHKRAWIVNML